VPTAKGGSATVEVTAPPDAVYALVADITRMGEWSPECYRCTWLDGATEPAVGARFRGFNRMGPVRWSTTAQIVAADVGEEFAFTVLHDGDGREETRWRFRFEPTSTGTSVTETYEFVWCPLVNRASELFVPRGRQVARGMRETLDRLKAAAEA